MPETDEIQAAMDRVASDLQMAADVGRIRTDPRAEDEEARDGGRIPLGGYSLSLALNGELEPGLTGRWFVDEGDRIANALRGGYRPVLFSDATTGYQVNVDDTLADQDQWHSKKTGRLESGAPQLSYLMAIKTEFYDHDQKGKQKVVDDLDEAIYNGARNPAMETVNAQGEKVEYHTVNIQNEFKR